MPTRPKYPDASTKANHYSNLATTLENYRIQIESEINTARNLGTTAEDSSVDGTYYDRYVVQKDKWIVAHGQMVAKFDAFVTQLNTCIANAQNKATMWQGRVSIMEVY